MFPFIFLNPVCEVGPCNASKTPFITYFQQEALGAHSDSADELGASLQKLALHPWLCAAPCPNQHLTISDGS